MKLPKSISILGQQYKIEEKPSKQVAEEVGANTVVGAVNYSDRRILIANDTTDVDRPLVIYHEFFHCMLFATGLSQSLSPEIQEVIAESFANGITDVLKQLDKAQKNSKQSKHGKKNQMRKVPRSSKGPKRK